MSWYSESPCKWKYRKCIDFNNSCDNCRHNLLINREISVEIKGKSYYESIAPVG